LTKEKNVVITNHENMFFTAYQHSSVQQKKETHTGFFFVFIVWVKHPFNF